MSVDPRAALDRLTAALEAHLAALTARRGEDDPAVDDAYDVLSDAFAMYDTALDSVFGESLPVAVIDDDDFDDEEEDDEGDDDLDEDIDDFEDFEDSDEE